MFVGHSVLEGIGLGYDFLFKSLLGHCGMLGFLILFFLQNAADSNFKKGFKNEHPNKLLALLVLTEL